PMWRIEVEADQKRLAGLRERIHRVDRTGAELVGEIADLVDLDVLVPQIVILTRVKMRVVVHGAPAETEEVIITALERTEFRQGAQMPLADQAGDVACPLQQRRQGRMLWRQADLTVARQGLLEP